MRVTAQNEAQEVAGGRRTHSAQARHATAALTPQLRSSQWPHPDSRESAARTTGAPHEGLLFAPLSARSQKPNCLAGEPSRKRRISR
jgi:hypothetical protein